MQCYIWDANSHLWWKTRNDGYTSDVTYAGSYPVEHAIDLCAEVKLDFGGHIIPVPVDDKETIAALEVHRDLPSDGEGDGGQPGNGSSNPDPDPRENSREEIVPGHTIEFWLDGGFAQSVSVKGGTFTTTFVPER